MYFTEFSEYLLPFTTLKRYQTRDSNGYIFTTAAGNVSITRYGVFLVTILLLEFVSIY